MGSTQRRRKGGCSAWLARATWISLSLAAVGAILLLVWGTVLFNSFPGGADLGMDEASRWSRWASEAYAAGRKAAAVAAHPDRQQGDRHDRGELAAAVEAKGTVEAKMAAMAKLKAKAAVQAAPAKQTEGELAGAVEAKMAAVAKLKAAGFAMETNPVAREAIRDLQEVTRALLLERYGPEPYRVEMVLTFPATMPDLAKAGRTGRVLVELAPMSLMPHAVFLFLDLVDHWKSGAFHRNARHVQQARCNGPGKTLAFQEYSAAYPHVTRTLGYAGRPGSQRAFYVSMQNNTINHGPGSQQKGTTEADSCFGKVIEGWDVVLRMKRQPGTQEKKNGFVEPESNHIQITTMRFLRRGSASGS